MKPLLEDGKSLFGYIKKWKREKNPHFLLHSILKQLFFCAKKTLMYKIEPDRKQVQLTGTVSVTRSCPPFGHGGGEGLIDGVVLRRRQLLFDGDDLSP